MKKQFNAVIVPVIKHRFGHRDTLEQINGWVS